MEREEEIPDCEYPSYRRPEEIGAMELSTALRSLHLLGDDPYLRMQAVNLSVVDHFIMVLEYDALRMLVEEERTPGPEAMFLSAQSQMWIFAAYELVRTWRHRAKKVLTWAACGGLKPKIADLEKDVGFRHFGRELRASQLRKVLENPLLVEQIRMDMRLSHMPFRRLEHIRMSLAKHEVAKKPGSIAYAPGYGRINQWCGSLEYQLEKGIVVLGTISRRDVAEDLRGMRDRGAPPTDESIASFDAFMDANHDDPFAGDDAARGK